MNQDINNLSIRNALITWCFEERVEDVREFEIYFLSQELAAFGYPNLGGASNRGEPAPLPNISREEARHHLDNAWKNLLLDFRQRVERGRLLVRGVQARPRRQIDRTEIPGQWAADFQIDALNDAIEIDEDRYIAVTVSSAAEDAARASAGQTVPSSVEPLRLTLGISQPSSGIDDTAEQVDVQNAEEVECAAAKIGPPRRPRGRPATASLIEDDLRANWEAVQRRTAQSGGKVPNWSELSAAMAKRFARTGRQQGQHGQQRFPHKNTIRKRLPQIYRRMVDKKTAQ